MVKQRIGVIYGSRTVEHEVSIITAMQVMEALDPEQYQVVPLYITREGEWLTGDPLRKLPTYKALNEAKRQLSPASISASPNGGLLPAPERGRLLSFGGSPRLSIEVAFPCMHGTFGEDGTLQGLLEMADLPYVGSGVLGSALGMDKIAMKALFKANDLPIVDWTVVRRTEWLSSPAQVLTRLVHDVGFPAFVKPANLGSSVGISRATDEASLRFALDVATSYDRRVLVEPSLEGAVDINFSILGYDDELSVSVCEQPVALETFLSYEDKYIRGGKSQGMKGLSRRIPAPIGEPLTSRIQDLARRAFAAIDASGVARIDFLLTPAGDVFVNEINTIPGSLSFYLWEATGLPFARLLDRLIQIALARHSAKKELTYTFDSALLAKTLESSGKWRR